MQLRPYQTEAISALRDAFRRGKRKVILCLPTGAGKTFTFSDLAKRTIEKGGRVLILTHRIELLTQAGGAMSKLGMSPFVISAKTKTVYPSDCYVAMVETFFRRTKKEGFMESMGKISLVIIDECHLGNFTKIIEYFQDTYIIGATATPVAAKKDVPLRDLYDEIVEPVDIPTLIKSGFLVPSVTYGAREELQGLKVKMGEYTDASLMQAFDKKTMYDDAISHYKQLADGRKTICFNVNIEHSLKMRDAFREAGIPAEHLDGTTPDAERERLLRDFKQGRFLVLNNVGVATTGYDEPTVSCVIINRASKSTALYFQCCGRGSRLAEGKKDFIIIDMGANFKEHGLWNEPINWRHRFENPKKPGKGGGVAPVKQCQECEAILPASTRRCEHCGFVYTKEAEERELLRSAGFVEIRPEALGKPWHTMNVRELEATRLLKGYKIGWAVHQLRPKGREALEEYAALKGYKNAWIDYQLNEEHRNEDF